LVKSCLLGLLEVVFITPAGLGHNTYIAGNGKLSQPSAKFIAINIRHADIDHNQIRLYILNNHKGVKGRMDNMNVMP
jgi:hypothetical protein